MSLGTFGVTAGTTNGLPVDTVSGTMFPYSKIDVGAVGSSVPWQGSVTVNGGSIVQTVGTVNTGTINTGTINVGTFVANGGTIGTLGIGTVDAVSALPLNVWGTTINTAASAFGTIKAAVSGSTIYITDLEISMGIVPGTVALYSGGTAFVIAGTWSFNANGGLVTNRKTPIFATSGSAICYQQQGTATLSITASGFVK